MLLNEHSFHIANMTHKAIMLNGHLDPTICHTSIKVQPTIIVTSLL